MHFNVFLVIQEKLHQSMIYSAEVLQMNLFIYLLGSSTDYHYISLQLGGWQQWTKSIIASFELFPLNQIISPYIYKHFQTLGQKCNAVHFRLILNWSYKCIQTDKWRTYIKLVQFLWEPSKYFLVKKWRGHTQVVKSYLKPKISWSEISSMLQLPSQMAICLKLEEKKLKRKPWKWGVPYIHCSFENQSFH